MASINHTTTFPYRIDPITNITPFSYRDGITYLELLYKLRDYMVDTVVPEFDTQLAEIVAQFNSGLGSWETRFDQFMLDLQAEIAALNDAGITQLINDELSSTRSTLDSIFERKDHQPLSVMEFKNLVVGDNWTAAFQKALDESLYVTYPLGTFNVDGLEFNNSGQIFRGFSRHGSHLKVGQSINFNSGAHVGGFDIADMTIESPLGGDHIIEVPYGINQGLFQRIELLQRNYGRSLFHCDRTLFTNGGIFDVDFTNMRGGMPLDSIVPGFHIKGGGNPFAANAFRRCRLEGGGDYLIQVEAGLTDASYAYNNKFDTINFEFANHGAINLISSLNTRMDAIGFFDMARGPITKHLINIGSNAGLVEHGTIITGLHRSGGTLDPGIADVKFNDPVGGGNAITGISCPPAAGMVLDLGNADTFLAGIDTTVTVKTTQPIKDVAGMINISGTRILTGSSDPDGVVVADAGSLYLRTAGQATGRVFYKEGSGNTGWVNTSPVGQPTSSFESITHSVNTGSKGIATWALNTTTKRPVWATGPAPGDVWVHADGTTAHTPI